MKRELKNWRTRNKHAISAHFRNAGPMSSIKRQNRKSWLKEEGESMEKDKASYTITKTTFTPFNNGQYCGFFLDWEAHKIGFGRLTFIFKDDKVSCETEYMSREFIDAVVKHYFDNHVNFVDK